MLLGIQIIGLLFALFMVYYSFISYKRSEFSGGEMGFWSFVWLIFLAVTLVPGLLDPVIEGLSISRRMDLLIIAGFMFLVGLTFYNYNQARRNKKKIEAVVRKVALRRR